MTTFKDKVEAEKIAEELNNKYYEFTYKVLYDGTIYVIASYDAEGRFMRYEEIEV